ncbi:MerR family transcriptional regulator [Isobaculum melis]|uniref:DNA-binding transcriptional regulator, MerR family n=1 Tax=Isobaculum melis TaxID=142588 RepID=A0A1H9RIY8_9LACT|nr:MerR family transcriptional regulator [Isobaculum melis]SER72505.1 DNA-binding transcriptional regulator, MerR family [Isobaculum melis]
MEYTVQKLAQLAGISSRTLRYYDEIDLLKPARINSSGYRIYGQLEVNLLQQILFYRAMDVQLDKIKKILSNPHFDSQQTLVAHHQQLLERKVQLEQLILTVEKTIAAEKGEGSMTDQEKFKGFKQELINKNEAQYGQEIRIKYGDEAIKQANAQLQGMSQASFNQATQLEAAIIETLAKAMATNEPAGALAQKVAAMHKDWLSFYWPSYTTEAHAGVAEMYLADERFTAYYDQRVAEGAAVFLREAILVFVANN